ncbi:MAG: DUF4381 family protein [Desulfobulbus sp.]|nr:DUF4381 family protein [Desulfobulbus sp.]
MKHIITTMLLIVSLLALSGTVAWCSEESPSSSPPLKLQNAPLATQSSQQVEEIHDIKGPVPVSDIPRFLIPALATIALLIIAVLVFFFLKRRRKPAVIGSPPDVIALAELDQARSLMAQPLIYAERISALLRQYIESRFQIRSTRQTTREFFSGLKSDATIAGAGIANHAGDLQECMEQCDLAKFAHGTPNQERMLGMDRAVRDFIETTRQRETP